MAHWVTVWRAAQLVGVPRGVLQQRVRAGEIELTDGLVSTDQLLRLYPQAQLERGITSTFFPHGLGHFLGLQVHDVGGFQAGPEGGTIAKPEGHPYLRLTRTLEPGHVVTVEPGIYFIPMLLAKLRQSADAGAVNWDAVEAMLPFGGIRIEDDVHVTEGAPENLTRNAFRAVAA